MKVRASHRNSALANKDRSTSGRDRIQFELEPMNPDEAMNDEGQKAQQNAQKRSRSFSPSSLAKSGKDTKQKQSILELQSSNNEFYPPLHLDINEGAQSLSQSMMSHSQSQSALVAASASDKNCRASQRSNSEFNLREKQLFAHHHATLERQMQE